MRVLLINTSERIGGAAVAASRLTDALNKQGVKAHLLVRDKQTDRLTTIPLPRSRKRLWDFVWERTVIWMHSHLKRDRLFTVDIANTGYDLTRLPEFRNADLIHLHWVNQGMLSLKVLRKILASGKPVVWTMHDMWPCTGICHHARTCEAYQSECGHCTFLYSTRTRDLSTCIFRKKQQLYRHYPVHFVTCSHWLEKEARKSAILQGQSICTIPNPLPIDLFKPGNRKEARTRCQLPQERRLLLFGSVKATDKRKGIDYLIEACRLLAEQRPALKEQLGILAVGMRSEQLEQLLPFKVYSTGYVSDEPRMADLYRAADLFVTPSLEENLPNTLMESLACGTPCVGFEVGGIPEMIDHLQNGYVARYRSSEDLAKGILWILDHPDYDSLCDNAYHKAIGNYSERIVATRYLNLYQQLLDRH